MNKREKILAGAVARVPRPFRRTITALESAAIFDASCEMSCKRLSSSSTKSTLAVASGRHAKQQLDNWQELSLPTNRDVAHTLYRAWLLQKTKDAGLTVEDINPNERTAVSTVVPDRSAT